MGMFRARSRTTVLILLHSLDPNDRTPDPERMLRYVLLSLSPPFSHKCMTSAYFHSTTTLNYVRGLLTSGFASLHHPRDWSLSHVRSPGLRSVAFTFGLCCVIDVTVNAGKSSSVSRMACPTHWALPVPSASGWMPPRMSAAAAVAYSARSISTPGNPNTLS